MLTLQHKLESNKLGWKCHTRDLSWAIFGCQEIIWQENLGQKSFESKIILSSKTFGSKIFLVTQNISDPWNFQIQKNIPSWHVQTWTDPTCLKGEQWWVGGFMTIMPRGSILQAGTFQILSLAENPRWSRVWQLFLDNCYHDSYHLLKIVL